MADKATGGAKSAAALGGGGQRAPMPSLKVKKPKKTSRGK